MPDGERVTTGSEPRRTFRVLQTYDEIERYAFDAAYSVLTWQGDMEPPLSDREEKFAERQAKLIAEGLVRNLDGAEEVVESGHDEQTEEFKPNLTGGPPEKLGDNPLGRALAAERERTVAAVVEALREHADELPSNSPLGLDTRIAANFIEERFKSSAPGGGNA